MLGVDSNDARVMYHLLKNHYMGIGLDYALVVIVKAGDRRHRRGKTDQAALGWRQTFRTVEWPRTRLF